MPATEPSPSKPRVVVAMSGGVDSSVAAYLLDRDGYDVIGVTMRLWTADDPAVTPDHQGCCSIDDIEDARRVCQTVGVPHYVMDVQREFREHVMGYFIAEYQRGRTPHPCIACNDRIKFDFLMKRAESMDAAFVATGHYARIGLDGRTGERELLRGVDAGKDQSYVLFGLSQEQLGHVLLPVGGYTKAEIRALAAEGGLHLADKADSQEICFIPQGDYREFLGKHLVSRPGDFVDAAGSVLGRHEGIERFTVGQRRGLGVASNDKLFVTAVEPQTARVVLGPASDLLRRGVRVGDVRYVGGAPSGRTPVTAKIRYNGRDMPGVLEPAGAVATLWFDEPQRAITPGQAAVFYDGDRVLGGGFIDGPAPESALSD